MADDTQQQVVNNNDSNETQAPYYDGWGLDTDDIGFLQSSKYADPAAVVKALRQTKSYVGLDKNQIIKIPKPDKDGNVDYSEVYTALGRPSKADEYGFGDTEFAKEAAQKLYDLGITSKQATALMEFMTAQDENNKKKEADEWNESVERGINELKKEWKADYDVNLEVAKSTVRDIVEKTGFTQEELDKVEKALGTDKATKLFFAIGSQNGGVKSLQNYNAGVETPEIASYKLKEMLADRETAKLLAQKDHKTMAEIKRLTSLSMKGN